MATGAWKLVVEICLPIPFVLLVGLLTPAPRVFHRGVLMLVDKTLGLTLVGVLSLLHVMLLITGAAFLSTLKTTYDLGKLKPDWATLTPNMQSSQLGKRWRAERNFWISLFCFTLWCVLARVYQLLKKKELLEDKYQRLLKGGVTTTTSAAPPPSRTTVPTVPPPTVKKVT